MPTRALVLSGGGVTGIAWEVGVLAGLLSAGVDLRNADVVIGSSAGAYVGAAYAGGYDIEKLFGEQLEANIAERSVVASPQVLSAWVEAFTVGGADRERIGAELGKLARSDPGQVSVPERRAIVESRLVVDDWPPSLQVTAIDADSGRLEVFRKESGVELIEAVSATGAVPGVWPLQRINGRDWIDGGMVSAANAHLAVGYERVVVLAPMPWSFGAIPGAGEDVQMLNETATAILLAPDEASLEAIGPNIYDPERRAVSASAGRNQGIVLAGEVSATWG